MSLGQIYEGWKNHILPEEKEKAYIEYVSLSRLAICNECDKHSKNHHTPLRPDIIALNVDVYCLLKQNV